MVIDDPGRVHEAVECAPELHAVEDRLPALPADLLGA